ncbi:CBS domain-containing protein [Mariprofundus erugo]|uniref:CBS domain-containing protein n=1 Tax=Mariprofundus erugo TaxID=2528639 RepID=A0A5R9GHR0_9PROT|nr:CBS domain-containing protein [Mariprofundus erugo]TLS66306.1 CBS domain-containing protein [Mariprofundus erugo]TLS78205.1 CBS domain-containing protein [Mariprofundus erugo]
MLATEFMIDQPHTCLIDEPVGDVFLRMRAQGLRMLPVLDAGGCVKGVLSTYSVLGHIVPDYILSGDLSAIPYAPDIDMLRTHYTDVAGRLVGGVMDEEYLSVGPGESLLSVAAALVGFGRHEYALVVDKDGLLKGMISAGDILATLRKITCDAR